MRCLRWTHIGLALLLCLTTFLLPQDKKEERSEENTPRSLIRKDLLIFEAAELKPPKRNIFTPQSAGWRESGDLESTLEGEQAGMEEAEAVIREEAARLTLGVRYIGYVKSGERITALILFEGEALAVNSGEEIANGVTISKISLEDIHVTGPDGELRKFPLEGDGQ